MDQSSGWNAHRHQSSPIGQPKYRFQDVEKASKSLQGSVVQEVSSSRESFKEIMAEMVLLCTEAVKRSRSGRTAGKPLSLEYIADRLDVALKIAILLFDSTIISIVTFKVASTIIVFLLLDFRYFLIIIIIIYNMHKR